MLVPLLLLCFALLILILLVRYNRIRTKYGLPAGVPDTPETGGVPNSREFPEKLADLIRIPTVSWTDRSKIDTAALKKFQEELVRLFPLVHREMEREVHSDFGLIYRWQGTREDLKPVLFLAHYDVVPAEEQGDETWQENPFGGVIKDGILWGRGTLDIKTQVAFQLETAEQLIEEGFRPERTIWFAFGGDEEISGTEGAGNLSRIFKERGLSFEFVMDEGGVIARDQLSFLKGRPAALVGMAEKGFVTFRISANGESGHSSMPSREGTAIGRVARGISRLEKNLFPAKLSPIMRNMLERFVPCVSLPLGVVFANLWLTEPLIRLIFSKSKTTDSLIRTTQAVTVFHAGEQENILPGEAACLVNHRILPGDTIDGIRDRHNRTLKDPELNVEDAGHWPSNNPIEAGDPEGTGFRLIRDTLAVTHPGVVAVPYLVNGATDSKYYKDLTEQILRFTPLVLTPEDIGTIHSVNEKVSLENLEKGLAFYRQFVKQL